MEPQNDGGRFSADQLQTLENTLEETPTPGHTRRWLLRRAALGAGVGAVAAPVAGVLAKGGSDSPQAVGTDAVTAEALAVTYLTHLLEKAGSGLGAGLVPIKAALAAEQDHYTFLAGAGFKPLTTSFWIPDAALQAANAAKVIEVFETIFVNAYLIGTTVFAQAGNATLARYAAEIAGVEASHRTLARFLQGKLPDNLAYESYKVKDLGAIVGQIEATGVGLGKKGSSPGAFYTYAPPPSSLTVGLDNSAPDQAIPLPAITATPVSGQPAMTG